MAPPRGHAGCPPPGARSPRTAERGSGGRRRPRGGAASSPIAAILAAQHPDGYWEPGPGYATKYRGNSVAADHPRPAWRRSGQADPGRLRLRPGSQPGFDGRIQGVGPVRDRRTAAVGRDPLSERKPAAALCIGFGCSRISASRGPSTGRREPSPAWGWNGGSRAERDAVRVRLRREREGTLRLGRSQPSSVWRAFPHQRAHAS